VNWDETLGMNLEEDNFRKKPNKGNKKDDKSYLKYQPQAIQGQVRMSTRLSIPFVHLEMLKF